MTIDFYYEKKINRYRKISIILRRYIDFTMEIPLSMPKKSSGEITNILPNGISPTFWHRFGENMTKKATLRAAYVLQLLSIEEFVALSCRKAPKPPLTTSCGCS